MIKVGCTGSLMLDDLCDEIAATEFGSSELACARGVTRYLGHIDRPRTLAKSVTVE